MIIIVIISSTIKRKKKYINNAYALKYKKKRE